MLLDLNPEPHSYYGSGSMTNKSMRIRIHNTDLSAVFRIRKYFYVLLPYITYVMQSGRFSQCPALLSQTAKERDKK